MLNLSMNRLSRHDCTHRTNREMFTDHVSRSRSDVSTSAMTFLLSNKPSAILVLFFTRQRTLARASIKNESSQWKQSAKNRRKYVGCPVGLLRPSSSCPLFASMCAHGRARSMLQTSDRQREVREPWPVILACSLATRPLFPVLVLDAPFRGAPRDLIHPLTSPLSLFLSPDPATRACYRRRWARRAQSTCNLSGF